MNTTEQSQWTVSYSLTAKEAIELTKIQQRLQTQPASYLGYYYVPAALGGILIAAAMLAGVKDAAGFSPLLVTGVIAYYSGYHTCAIEYGRVWRASFEQLYRDDPTYTEPWTVSLQSDAMVISTPRHTTQLTYLGMRKAEIVGVFAYFWTGSTPNLVAPVRAFTSAAEASAFADEFNRRIDNAKTRVH